MKYGSTLTGISLAEWTHPVDASLDLPLFACAERGKEKRNYLKKYNSPPLYRLRKRGRRAKQCRVSLARVP